MGVGIVELSGLLLVTLIVVAVIVGRRGRSAWLLLLPFCLLLAVLASPADPVSAILMLIPWLAPFVLWG